jgi:hypothetical protein
MTRSRLCTRVIALIAAYAIAVHGFLLAFGGLPVVAGTANDGDTPRLELCLHNVGAFSPDTPAAPSSDDVHCKFCVAEVHSLFVAPAPSGMLFIFQTPGVPISSVQDQDKVGFSRYFQKQPRGPPAAA